MPFRNAPRDRRVQRAKVGLHRRRLESNAKRLAVQPMLLKIHQHQPTGEQAIEQETPAVGGGKVLVAIKEYEFVGFWSQERDRANAKQVVAVDRPVLAVHQRDMADGVPESGKGVADDRPTVFSRKVCEPIAPFASANV